MISPDGNTRFAHLLLFFAVVLEPLSLSVKLQYLNVIKLFCLTPEETADTCSNSAMSAGA